MLNIAEGFARRTNNEFRHFLFVAHGSVAEVQSALYAALDQDYLTHESFYPALWNFHRNLKNAFGLNKVFRKKTITQRTLHSTNSKNLSGG